MSTQSRQPAGVPVGGQFATSTRTEPNVVLRPPVPSTQQRDELAMDRIALCLGAVDEWHGSADYLEYAATELRATGRPAVGDQDVEEFQAQFDAYLADRSGPVTATTRALDELALALGTSPEWSADDLETIAIKVVQSGRPDPGGAVDPDEYIARIAAARAERSSTFEAAQSEIADGLASYLDRHRDELVVGMAGFTVHPEQADDGTWSYSRTITIRAAGNEDEELDLSGTPAEGLLDDLATYSPWVGELVEVTR